VIKRGQQAEDAAFNYLRERGLTEIERNYRCRFGEIDLIMRDVETVVFVEVRQRSSNRFGGALNSIDARKKKKLLTTARHYMAAKGAFSDCRFDAVLLNGDNRVEWIRDAFGE
jgi:putative endonuclease